jgi:hypothetical protein
MTDKFTKKFIYFILKIDNSISLFLFFKIINLKVDIEARRIIVGHKIKNANSREI